LIGLAVYSFIYPWLIKSTTGSQNHNKINFSEAPLWGILVGCPLWVLMAIATGDVGVVNFRTWVIFAWIILFVINLAFAHHRSVRRATALN
jgi:hypothetical protein